DVAVDPFQDVVTLLEWAAGNCAGAHCYDVFWLRHLVVEPDDLGRHFLCHRAGDDHEVGLPGRRTKHFRAKPGQIVSSHAGGDHFDGATSETKLQGPDGVFATPVVKLFQLQSEDALLAQLSS